MFLNFRLMSPKAFFNRFSYSSVMTLLSFIFNLLCKIQTLNNLSAKKPKIRF